MTLKEKAAFIRGIQKKGVAACAKHFAVNSQELRRMAMNSVLDERTLREIGSNIGKYFKYYYAGFDKLSSNEILDYAGRIG